MEALCFAFIESNASLQMAIVETLVAQCPFGLLESIGVSTTPHFGTQHTPPSFPSNSPGHPPYPHALCPPSGPTAPPAPPVCLPSVVHVHLTVDAFDSLNVCPSLGTALVTSPDVLCQPAFVKAVSRWLMVHASRGLMEPTAASTPLSTLPRSFLEALAANRTTVTVSLLVIRVPSVLSVDAHSTRLCGSTDLLGCPNATCDAWCRPRSVSHHRRDVVCGGPRRSCSPPRLHTTPVGLNISPLSAVSWSSVSSISLLTQDTSSMTCDVDKDVTLSSPPGRSILGSPGHGLTAMMDSALSTDWPRVRCLAVVAAVFFSSRAAVAPLPFVKVRLLPSTSPHLLAESLLVDLRTLLMPSSRPSSSVTASAREAAVIGCVWELHGVARTAWMPTKRTGTGAGSRKAPRLWHYVAATTITLPLCRVPVALSRTGTEVMEACVGRDALDAACEERAAREAFACWQGLRIALGVQPAPAPCELGTINTTAFFSLSLDAVVAVLIALYAAPMPLPGASLSVLVVDEASSPFLSALLARLADIAPAAVWQSRPTSSAGAAAHWRWQDWLPTYRTRALSTATQMPCAVSADSDATPLTESCAALMETVQETISGGSLTDANGCTVVVDAVDVLPSSLLAFLRTCLSTRSSADGTGGVPTVTAGACGASELQHVIAPAPADMAATHKRAVRRQGGQEVPYDTAHSFLGTLRGGSALSASVFEFVRRADVVIRPAMDVKRQQLSLLGASDGDFQVWLRSTSTWWADVVTSTLSVAPTSSAHSVPELDERCGGLLRLYFLAACATYATLVDSGLMETLTTLTRCHAFLRQSVAQEAQNRYHGGRSAIESARPPATHLIDVIVAIGLCDSTLYFLSQKALLRQCVFQILESHMVPTDGADQADPHLPSPPTSHAADSFWHTLNLATSWSAVETGATNFSVVRLSEELESYLTAQLAR